MTYQGRSLDDLPLAAYSTGVAADEPEEAVVESTQLSQQAAVAHALGLETPADETRAAATDAIAAADVPRRPRLALPRVSMPRFSLPRLPRLGGRGRAASAAEPPFQLAPAAAATPMTSPAVPAPVAGTVGRTGGLAALGGIGATLRNPRTAARDPRVLFGGMVAVGLVLLGVSMLGGGNAGGGLGPGASASAAPGSGVGTAPGPATVQVTGAFESTFTLTGSAGFGKPADGQLASAWNDGAGSAVSLTGPVASGTRTTSAELVLAVTVIRNGVPVTFTSEAGECTIGMAEKLFNITGSFVCPEVTSDDGRVTVKLTGTYQT